MTVGWYAGKQDLTAAAGGSGGVHRGSVCGVWFVDTRIALLAACRKSKAYELRNEGDELGVDNCSRLLNGRQDLISDSLFVCLFCQGKSGCRVLCYVKGYTYL
jgi:hypothetical protein